MLGVNMATLIIAIALLSAICSFLAGWYFATSSNRTLVFKERLKIYQALNVLLSELFHLNLDKIQQPDEYKLEYIRSKKELGKFFISNSMLLFPKTSHNIQQLLFLESEDTQLLVESYNKITSQMADDLNLSAITYMDKKVFLLAKDI